MPGKGPRPLNIGSPTSTLKAVSHLSNASDEPVTSRVLDRDDSMLWSIPWILGLSYFRIQTLGLIMTSLVFWTHLDMICKSNDHLENWNDSSYWDRLMNLILRYNLLDAATKYPEFFPQGHLMKPLVQHHVAIRTQRLRRGQELMALLLQHLLHWPPTIEWLVVGNFLCVRDNIQQFHTKIHCVWWELLSREGRGYGIKKAVQVDLWWIDDLFDIVFYTSEI